MSAHLQYRFKQWLQRLSRARRFYAGGCWQVHDSRSLFAEQVIGRDHCQYLCLDLSHLPTSKRADALVYQIASHSPWPDPDYQVAWHKGVAQLWFWPALPVATQTLASHVEPVFWQPPVADGLYLYRCARGFDLQYWAAGCLRGSQWFASEPDQDRQRWFLRSQGLPATGLVAPQQPISQSQPWSAVRTNPMQGVIKQPATALRWAAYGFVLLVSLQLTGWMHWHWQAERFQQQHALLQQQLGDVLEQRARARNALAQHQRLAPLFERVDPLQVQYLLTRRLAAVTDFTVVNWSRQDLQAELIIESTAESTLSMVNALRGEGVRDVQAEPGPRPSQYRLTVQMQPPLPFPEGVADEG